MRFYEIDNENAKCEMKCAEPDFSWFLIANEERNGYIDLANYGNQSDKQNNERKKSK